MDKEHPLYVDPRIVKELVGRLPTDETAVQEEWRRQLSRPDFVTCTFCGCRAYNYQHIGRRGQRHFFRCIGCGICGRASGSREVALRSFRFCTRKHRAVLRRMVTDWVNAVFGVKR